MNEKIYKTFAVESKAIDPEAGIYEAMISTEDVDRDGDIMVAAGAKIDDYLKNPIVLFGHAYREAQAVVGKTLELEAIPNKGIRARWQFAGPEISEHADLVRRLWASKFLNATSIGFIPHKFEPRVDANGEALQQGRKFTEWELLEYSVVSVPANQNALRLAYKMLEDDKECSGEQAHPVTGGMNNAEPTTTETTEPITDAPSHDASEAASIADVSDDVLAETEKLKNLIKEKYHG
jgi:phage head maturation protease